MTHEPVAIERTMTLETLPFDAAKYIATPQSQAELIADALESGAPQLTPVLGVMKALGMRLAVAAA